jgi:hypothetical protein
MEKPPKRKLIVVITNNFAAINLVHSGFIQKLADKHDLYIISDIIGDQEIVLINRYFEIDLNLLNVRVPAEPMMLRFVRFIEKTMFFLVFKTNTHKIKMAERSSLVRSLFQGLNMIVGPFAVRHFILKCIRNFIIFLSARLCKCDPASYTGFSGVISSSPLDIRENIIVNRLALLNTPALAIIISWDNLTSKGIINANHQYVMVWNEFMACEFENFYADFHPRPRLCITGIPRFDIYFRKQTPNFLEMSKRKRFPVGTAKVILYATSAPRHFPEQADIVDDLLEYCRVRGSAELRIRLHPADKQENYKRLGLYNSIQFSFAGDNGRFPELNYLESLADTLNACHVCVQVASTMRLDAAACKKPVISIRYDGRNKLPYGGSVRRLYDYSHQLPVNELSIDKMVDSKQELFFCLDEVLNNASDYSGNERLIQLLAHFDKACSVSTMIRNVEEWLG